MVTEGGALEDVEPRRRRGDHRIAGILLPGDEVIAADGDARSLGRAVHPGIHQGRDALVVDGAAGPAATLVRSAGRRSKRDWQVGPMNKIGADRVAPVDRAMEWAIGVVLVEEV